MRGEYLPDPRDIEGYNKLRKLVDSWVVSRDKRVMRPAYLKLVKEAQGDYVSSLLDPDSTNTEFRRYGRYLFQCERVAAAFSGGRGANTMFMVADYPAVSLLKDTISAGFPFFTSPSAGERILKTKTDQIGFFNNVADALGYRPNLCISDLSGERALLGVTSESLERHVRPSFLFLLTKTPSKGRSGIEVVGHMMALVDGDGALEKRIFCLTGDIRSGTELRIHVFPVSRSVLRSIKRWCKSTFQNEAKNISRRRKTLEFRDPPMDPVDDITSTYIKKLGLTVETIDWPKYMMMPYRGAALVGFFDLLGFSYFLDKNWSALGRPEEILKQLRADLVDSGLSSWGSVFPEVRCISDSIAAVVPIEGGASQLARGVGTAIQFSTRLQALAARLGFGVRGAIEFGEIYCDSVDLTGPALARCVKLEKIASGMRTLIGPNLLAELSDRLDELTIPEKHVFGDGSEVDMVPKSEFVFGFIRQSEDGLLRAIYPMGIKPVIENLQNEAPSKYTKEKYAEFLRVFEGDRIESFIPIKNYVPTKDVLLAVIGKLNRLMEAQPVAE